MVNKSNSSKFKIGDVVYILGKYMPNALEELHIIEAKISHIEHRQFVAYETDGPCSWKFSNKHCNKAVFKDKEKATEEWKKYNIEKEKKYG